MIHDILPVNNYRGNNYCTTFDFNFYIENETQLNVYHYDKDNIKTKLQYNIDYSINQFKNSNGSYITFPLEGSSYSTLNENEQISLKLTLPIAQETQYNNSSLLNLEALEYSLDYLTRLIQIYSRKFELCVKVEECSDVKPSVIIEDINNKANIAKESLQEINNINSQIQNIQTTILSAQNEIINKKTEIDNIKNSFESTIANLPKAENIDGRWTRIYQRVITNVNIGASEHQVDISSYIPKNGHDYEVIVGLSGNPSSTSGVIYLIGDYGSYVLTRATAANNVANAVSGILVLGQNRIIKITTTSDTLKWNNCQLNVYACKKLGLPM